MSENTIPQYHPSYTEEQNRIMHEYLENATPGSLVESILELCQLYPPEEQEKILSALSKFRKEIADRQDMEQRYQKIVDCRNAWRKYADSLYRYLDVIEIRACYKRFKSLYTSKWQDDSLLEMFIKEYRIQEDGLIKNKSPKVVKLVKTQATEFIRSCTFSESSSRGFTKPDKRPDSFYSSIEEISTDSISATSDSLELLGVKNLKYILIMLLQYVDSVGNENVTHVILSFVNRKYSAYVSHKKTLPLFSTNTLTYLELKEKCLLLLKELEEFKKEALKLEKKLP